jgi:hypothetical protein
VATVEAGTFGVQAFDAAGPFGANHASDVP